MNSSRFSDVQLHIVVRVSQARGTTTWVQRLRCFVVARSTCNEAIQFFVVALDRFRLR
jgi:hypothetical protein